MTLTLLIIDPIDYHGKTMTGLVWLIDTSFLMGDPIDNS